MRIKLIQVPYHLQHENAGMGAGPARYIQAGAADLLAGHGHEVVVERVTLGEPARSAEDAVAEIDLRVAEEVRQAVAAESFPIILSGNCHTVLGTAAGLGSAGLGIAWFDAHGDYNTPETSLSGFLDGMSLAIANGRAHPELRRRIGLQEPIPEHVTLLLGVRDLDPGERELLASSEVRVVPADELRGHGLGSVLLPSLDELSARVEEIYLHVDVDVLDPQEAPANEYNKMPGGLAVAEVEEAVRMIAARFSIRAAALTAFNPSVDQDDKTLNAGLRLLSAIADGVAAGKERRESQ